MDITEDEWGSLCKRVKEIHTTVLGNGKPEESICSRMFFLESKMKALCWILSSCLVGGIVVALGVALS